MSNPNRKSATRAWLQALIATYPGIVTICPPHKHTPADKIQLRFIKH